MLAMLTLTQSPTLAPAQKCFASTLQLMVFDASLWRHMSKAAATTATSMWRDGSQTPPAVRLFCAWSIKFMFCLLFQLILCLHRYLQLFTTFVKTCTAVIMSSVVGTTLEKLAASAALFLPLHIKQQEPLVSYIKKKKNCSEVYYKIKPMVSIETGKGCV